MGKFITQFDTTQALDNARVNYSISLPNLSLTKDDNKIHYIKEPQYVDLGLTSGTLWATMNLGAENEFDNGCYFSWGNLENSLQKNDSYDFSQENYEYTDGSSLEGNFEQGNTRYDAARSLWEGTWAIPRVEQFQELLDETIVSPIDGGWRLTSTNNGKSIIIPDGGVYDGTTLTNYLGYWTNSFYNEENAEVLTKGGDNALFVDYLPRYYGCLIRPVKL